jgi:hypothetical protein
MTLLDISSWWQTMGSFEKIFWGIALLFTLLFLIQTIMSFTAGDGDESFGDADAAMDSDTGIDYGFFTIKNFIAFFTIFGWTGIALIKGNMSKGITISIALAAGIVVVLIMMFLFRTMSKLKESGTLQLKNAVGVIGEAYLFIPASRNGFGKVHLKIQGSLHELQAVTDDVENIATGKLVKVVNIINDKTLLVTGKF